MDRDHTFDLPDLTEDFWKTVVFAQKEHPSGMGGPGCVWLVSEDGKVYFFGFEETPFYKCDELFPIFETTDERMDPSWQDWQLVWIIWNGMIILEAFFTWKK